MDKIESDDVTDLQEEAPGSVEASQVEANDNDENNNHLAQDSNNRNSLPTDELSTHAETSQKAEENQQNTESNEVTEGNGQEGRIDVEPEEQPALEETPKDEEEGVVKKPSDEKPEESRGQEKAAEEKGGDANELSAQNMAKETKDEERQGETELTADDPVDAKSEAESTAGGSLIPTPTPATKIRLNTRKHTTTPADDSGLAQPVLPTVNKGQANVHQMTTSITHARRKQDGLLPISKQPVRNRVPPKLVRLATVTVSPAKSRPHKTASLYYEEPKRPAKVITWDQATNHRPPLRIDMEGPGPCSYSPLNKPLNETNAPCFTFGTKCYPEKDGGARTSWGKSWFQSSHLWHSKADYSREGLWPSPNHYPKPALLGPRQRTMTEAPSYTFGHRANFSIVKPGAAKEPSPNDYERQNADSLVLRRGPSFTHQFRREGTVLWGNSEKTPAPCTYAPDPSPRVQRPAYTIQGIRREKSHVLGPYSTL